MTRVVHCKKEPYDVYIGRPSLLGNPFALQHESERVLVLTQFRVYAEARMKSDPKFAAAIRACKGKVLGCWCAPRPCHGDVIAELAEEKIESY